jgi:TRAP-type C4-dicarboxylate transport system permease small subunit
MNRVIAEIFASLVSLMHIAVLAALAFATFYHFSDNAPGLDPYLSLIGLDRDWFLVALAAVGIVYVLIVGILSTIIAINQNLERLVVAIQESRKNEAE